MKSKQTKPFHFIGWAGEIKTFATLGQAKKAAAREGAGNLTIYDSSKGTNVIAAKVEAFCYP